MFQEILKFAIFLAAKLTHSLDQLPPKVKKAFVLIWKGLLFGHFYNLAMPLSLYILRKKLLSPCWVFSLQKALA